MTFYLSQQHKWTPEEAVSFIKGKRPHASIRKPQWEAIRLFYANNIENTRRQTWGWGEIRCCKEIQLCKSCWGACNQMQTWMLLGIEFWAKIMSFLIAMQQKQHSTICIKIHSIHEYVYWGLRQCFKKKTKHLYTLSNAKRNAAAAMVVMLWMQVCNLDIFSTRLSSSYKLKSNWVFHWLVNLQIS